MSILPKQKSKDALREITQAAVEQQKAESDVERVEAVGEQSLEIMTETKEGIEPVEAPVEQKVSPPFSPAAVTTPAIQKDTLTKKIESVLEEDLKDIYQSMPPTTQQVFKQKGEETASKIRQLLTQTKVNAKKIFELVRAWLRLIPGVNRFFLEQEAKIKTDKILITSEKEQR